jgi:putative FmdB family regulatory protein
MPLYEYLCTDCKEKTTKLQSFNASNRSKCPKCGGEARRVISQSSFQLKGDGWYKDHYGLKSNG